MNRIKELRRKHNMTQDMLAEKLYLKRSVISKYENGTVPLTDNLIKVLSQMFGVTSDYLLGLSDFPTNRLNHEISHISEMPENYKFMFIDEAFSGLTKEEIDNLTKIATAFKARRKLEMVELAVV